jgi:hypothetical protein
MSTRRYGSAPLSRRLPMDLARKLVRPWQGCLIGKRPHQNGGARGVRRTNWKLKSIAQERSHLLMLRDHVDRGLPPPCWRGRTILLGNGAPLRKFANSALELKFCCLMHAVPHVAKKKDNRQGLRPFPGPEPTGDKQR